ncbi:MAG: UDP-glucose 4-epimerase GalE [Marinimicrobium sp.]|nr:UDP-glucose 4-epimerase GalE [Marinimicrobium sp.]
MMENTILVTGGAGFICSHTCIALHEAGFRPVILDNFSNASARVLDQLERITGQRFPLVRGDIRDADLLRDTFQRYCIDAVFHFAALKAVGDSVRQPLAYYENNVGGSIALLQVMQQCGVRRMVFSSSATVYGEPHYVPIDEAHPIGATNPYGWTKVMVEQLLRDVATADPDFLALALRYFNPVGAHESGLLGEDPLGTPNNLVPFIAQTAIGRREHVQVFGADYQTADGTGVRDYIHVMDLAEGHVAAFRTHRGDFGFKPYNLGTGRGSSVLEVINAFEKSCGSRIPWKAAPRRPGDVAVNWADPALAVKRLNWQARRDLQTMTDDVWRWQSAYPNGLQEHTS